MVPWIDIAVIKYVTCYVVRPKVFKVEEGILTP
jgi:hypothetical protein